MAIQSTSVSVFAPPSPHLSNEVRALLNELELEHDTQKLVHMRTGRCQLETFVRRNHAEMTTFEQIIARDSMQWEKHVEQAQRDKNVRVQQRSVRADLLPGLTRVHDIKVGRRGRPDDAVYFASEYARAWLPRGNCIAEWDVNGTTYFFPLVRGYRKFTGQEDDGELTAVHEHSEKHVAKFFTKARGVSKWVIATSKENGEAGHLAVLKRHDGEFVYVLGSKNTHLLAQTVDDIQLMGENQRQAGTSDAYGAARPIAAALLRMLLALDPTQRMLLCEFLWQTRATASFEILCPSHQHIQLLDILKEDTPVFYGLSFMTLDAVQGVEICVNPVLLYEFMRKLGVRTVNYEVMAFNINTIQTALEDSKCTYQHEGVVHLFLDDTAAVIGMQKHKTVWYVCLRAIREKAKTFCRTLNSSKPPKGRAHPMTPQEALETAKKSIQKRFHAIKAFVRISDEVANAYKTLGEQFIEYLFQNELFSGVAVDQDAEECKQVASDVASLFPVVWRRFLNNTGLSDKISSYHRTHC